MQPSGFNVSQEYPRSELTWAAQTQPSFSKGGKASLDQTVAQHPLISSAVMLLLPVRQLFISPDIAEIYSLNIVQEQQFKSIYKVCIQVWTKSYLDICIISNKRDGFMTFPPMIKTQYSFKKIK